MRVQPEPENGDPVAVCDAAANGLINFYQANRDTNRRQGDSDMNDEAFNMSIRKFLKMVGVRSQLEIERAVTKAIADGKLKGSEVFTAHVQLTIAQIGLSVVLDGEIKLE